MLYRIFLYFVIFIKLFLFSLIAYYNAQNSKAVIIVPVVDAVNQSLIKENEINQVSINKNVIDLYNSLEYAPERGRNACLRTHQLLFNEVVIVRKEFKSEVQCELNSLFYYDERDILRQDFWVPKSALKYFKDIKEIDIKAIPFPYRLENAIVYKKNILTLIFPWHDVLTKKTYSSGTRFIRNLDCDTKNYYSIFLLDSNLGKVISYVDKSLAIVEYPNDYETSIDLFMDILKRFLNKDDLVIPYLWGGCSYIDRLDESNFKLKIINQFGQLVKVWTREIDKRPLTGFECSSLILRVAQIVGMPYFCKNTATLSKTLRPLIKGEYIEKGDLIWYEGHVLIVSDVDKNLLIESVGYPLGYGKLHEINISKIFKDVKDYKELLNLYLRKEKLQRIDKIGKVYRYIDNFLILKFKSIW